MHEAERGMHMRLRTLSALAVAAMSSVFVGRAVHAQDVLTGDTRLACEAVLCLASGTRPSECTPSLSRYFSISHRRWRDTLRGRIDFLNLCPRGDDPQMTNLVNAEGQGAGRCDAGGLNALGYYDVNTGAYIVPDTLPSYCGAYLSHPYTYNLSPTYVGIPGAGGAWVDPT